MTQDVTTAPLPPPPRGWSDDDITRFFDVLRLNTYATFDNLRLRFDKLVAVDSAYRKLQDNLHNTKDWFAGFFLLRAHSNLLAGISLCASGQLPEAQAMLRSCLENGLYGLYLARHPASRETWLRRHDNEECRRRVRNEFHVSTLIAALRDVDHAEADVAQHLYDRAIDYGAHPNERALMQSLQMKKGDDNVEFKIIYCGGERLHFELAMKSAAQVGVCVLSMFQNVYRERFALIGLADMMHDLKRGL